MPVIKRYPNRKLYNTEKKQYITLDDIAEIIRHGEDVQVIDNATGEDITALTLTQIIYEQEKKQSGFLPRSILTGLIQASGSRLNAIQRMVTTSVGYWHQIDEEIRRRIQNLVKQGDLTETEGVKLLEKLLWQEGQTQEIELRQEQFLQILEENQVPTRHDIENLMQQLNDLEKKIRKISESE